MIGILRDKVTSKHLAVWQVDGDGQGITEAGEGQELLTWATDMATYEARARQLAGGPYSACYGATSSEMAAEPALPAPAVGIDLVGEEFEKYVAEKSLGLSAGIKVEDMGEVLRRAKAREGTV